MAPQAHCQRANCHRERPGMPTSGRRRCRKPGGSQCGGLRFWHPVCCSVVLCLWISVCFDRLVFALGGSSPLAPLPLLSVLWQGRSRDRRRRGVEGPRGTVRVRSAIFPSKLRESAQRNLPFQASSKPLRRLVFGRTSGTRESRRRRQPAGFVGSGGILKRCN